MEWDMQWPDEEFRPAAETKQRENVPEGRHRFEIAGASEDGAKLKVSLAVLGASGQPDKAYGWVWVTANRETDFGRRQVANLAQALGLSPAAWKATAVADLQGRQVEAEIVHRQTDRLWVNVDRFYAPAAVAEVTPAKPARRPAAAKAIETDDIPF